MTARVCEVEGCGRAHQARGFCDMHFHRWRRHGDPFVVNQLGRPTSLDVDEVVVERILAGDLKLAPTATRGERQAVIGQWRGSDQSLYRATGWNVWRERRAMQEAG